MYDADQELCYIADERLFLFIENSVLTPDA